MVKAPAVYSVLRFFRFALCGCCVRVRHDFHLAAQRGDKTHQAIDRETTKPTSQQRGTLGLVDP